MWLWKCWNKIFMSSLNVRVLLLIRDPRGTMQSRKHRFPQMNLYGYGWYGSTLPNSRIWCPCNPDCDDPKMLCQDLVDDYQAFQVIIHVCYMLKTFFCRCSQRSSRADTCKLLWTKLKSDCLLYKYYIYTYTGSTVMRISVWIQPTIL